MEEILARHRKELKALDGEKRAALKKAKATKGKKAKDLLAETEAEYEKKLKEMEARHKKELGSSTSATSVEDNSAVVEEPTEATEIKNEPELSKEQSKIEKARRKREKQKEKERAREQAIAEELANAGPTARHVENETIQQQLTPLHMKIQDVTADGHCLYRAVAAQSGQTFLQTRALCADTLEAHEDSLSPFCEYTDEIPDYATYCNRVRNSADWGGHLELRALSIALKRPILVYSTQAPLRIEEESSDGEPIRLSYHLNYYALGEHYNQVVPAVEEEQ